MATWQADIAHAHPEVCETVLALHILNPEPDLPEGISLILQSRSAV